MNVEPQEGKQRISRPEKPASRFLIPQSVHALRVAMLLTILVVIHFSAKQTVIQQAGRNTTISAAVAARVLPGAVRVDKPTAAGAAVFDAKGDRLGYVLQTSPESDHITGFSGPSNVLIAFDPQHKIAALEVLSSGDTREHLEQVTQHGEFLKSFNGMSLRQAAGNNRIDAVSGATLTCLAIHESVVHRLDSVQPAGSQPTVRRQPAVRVRRSLRFPEPPQLAHARKLFPQAASLQPHPQQASLYVVRDKEGSEAGSLLRTSPAADQVIGYGGPTETYIGFKPTGEVAGIAIGKSYDNEPYVGYVRDEEYFLTLFNGLKLVDLAKIDATSGEVEGVSGATMTSQSVVEGMQKAAAKHQADLKAPPVVQPVAPLPAPAAPPAPPVENGGWDGFTLRVSLHDYGVAGVILFSLLLAFTHLRSNRWLRFCFLVVLVIYLGFTTGSLLSQAMFAGWARSGVPWRKAPGLVMLTAAALLTPVFTGRNLYCSHLCPHGAVQQLIKRRLPWQWTPPAWLTRWLKLLPAALLVWCVIVAVLALPFSLIGIEPFDAWMIRIAGWATIAVAVSGLVFSLFTPMAYCRYGCPTGALLKFLTFTSASHQWSRRDWFALALTMLACGLWLV